MNFDKLGIHPSWWEHFEPLFKEKFMIKILNTIKNNHLPTKDKIFAAFKVPLHEVQTVFMGQDPYPDPKKAVGVAFAVPKGLDSPSLKVIRDAVFAYTGDIRVDVAFDRTFQHWTDQGVLMLNSALTTEPYKVGCHQEVWKPFIVSVISIIEQQNTNVEWVLMGKNAKEFAKYIKSPLVHLTCHPMAETYSDAKLFSGVKNNVFFKLNRKFVLIDDLPF